MHITIEHFQGKYPSFNVALSSQPNSQPFLVVKGCRIVNGPNGPFVSGPATKNETSGKYWNHTYFNDAFAQAVLEKAIETQTPAPAPTPRTAPRRPSQDAARARQLPPQEDDFQDSVPF